MKKRKRSSILLYGTGICIIILGLSYNKIKERPLQPESGLNESSADKIAEISLGESSKFIEETTNLEYNYISNPSCLDAIECPLGGIMTIGDQVNDYLQTRNITGQTLNICNFETDKVNYTVWITGDSLETYICTYNIVEKQWKIEKK